MAETVKQCHELRNAGNFQKLEKDGKIPKTYPQQEAVVFALKRILPTQTMLDVMARFHGLRRARP